MAAVPRVEGTSVAVDASRTERPGDTANWHYLTGSIPAVSVVAEAVGFRWRCDSAQKQFLHPAGHAAASQGRSLTPTLPLPAV
jgi:hypothetical protein